MKFRIKRASADNDEGQPTKYAYSELSDWVQVVSFPTIEEHDKKHKSFRSEGTNHKVIGDGTIERTFPDYKELWYIDINSLEELISFQKENKKNCNNG